MVAEVNSIVSRLKWPSPNMTARCIKLGISFEENSETKKIMSAITRRKYVPLKTRVDGRKKKRSSSTLNSESRFYLFLLVLNNNFDSRRNAIFEGYEENIKTIAASLDIDDNDYRDLMKFYLCNTPYCDKSNALYIAHEKASCLIKSSGINVQFTGKSSGETIYLKYFEKHDLFLSKTFSCVRPYNEILEDIKTKEINIISAKSYKSIQSFYTFKELKECIRAFYPLQTVEVSETDHTPRVILDPLKNLLSISGPSVPLSPTTYFEPVLDWLKLYSVLGNKKLDVCLAFKYFNTYTTKFLMRLVKNCNQFAATGKEINFYWYYEEEDDEMREFGEYLRTQACQEIDFQIAQEFVKL
jgi:hypothetical protein